MRARDFIERDLSYYLRSELWLLRRLESQRRALRPHFKIRCLAHWIPIRMRIRAHLSKISQLFAKIPEQRAGVFEIRAHLSKISQLSVKIPDLIQRKYLNKRSLSTSAAYRAGLSPPLDWAQESNNSNQDFSPACK